MRMAAFTVFVLGLLATASAGWGQVIATVDFLAGKTIDVGDVKVYVLDYDGDGQKDLCFKITMQDDWKLKELHYIASQNDLKGTDPIPGQFPGKVYYAPPVSETEMLLLWSDVKPGERYYIAVHGKVEREVWTDLDGDGQQSPSEITLQEETAWAAGERFKDQGPWATYFYVDIPQPRECLLKTVNFIAGQYYDAGNVEVYLADGDGDGEIDDLCIRVVMENGWVLSLLHYANWTSPPPAQNPSPGQWPQQAYDPPVTSTDMIMLVQNVAPGMCYIAVHGNVQLLENGQLVRSDSAWAEGQRFVPKGNWAMYFWVDVPSQP